MWLLFVTGRATGGKQEAQLEINYVQGSHTLSEPVKSLRRLAVALLFSILYIMFALIASLF